MMQQLYVLLVTQIPSKLDRLFEDHYLLSLFRQCIAAESSFVQQRRVQQ